MNTPSQTTEFSAHLSWAAMRRYLQEVLPADKSQQVERHLHHCPRCSSAIVDYIRAEEPEHYKQYTKKLKGILKTGQAEKKSVLSSFQRKAVRTTTAVVALLIFSFFALKTVINKQAEYPLPSESLAATEKSEKAAPVRRSSVKRATKATVKAKATVVETPKETVKATKKTADTPLAEAPTVITKARSATVPATAAVVAPVRQEQPRVELKTKITEGSTDNPTPPAINGEAPVLQEKASEAPANPSASHKPLPSLQRLDAIQNSETTAPLDGSAPTEMPVPSNEILER